jgi:sulfate transport system permease protein
VASGLIYVLVFGAQGWFGPVWRITYSYSLCLARHRAGDHFCHLPFVARELIHLMVEQGRDEEGSCGHPGRFGLSHLPARDPAQHQMGPALRHLLCNARALGEFGAVSVVSGHIRGVTNTMPLHVELLYNNYDYVGAFAVAALLAMLGLVTLVLKSLLEWRYADELAAVHRH